MSMKNDELKRLWLAGAGNFGSEVEGFLNLHGVKVDAYLDDTPGLTKSKIVLPIDEYPHMEGDQVIVAISDPKGRESVHHRLRDRGAVFHGLLMHICPASAFVGGGCITCPYSVVSAFAKVGNFCIINIMSSVGHHVTIGDYCTLASHVDICGHVTVGKGVVFGSGARVLPRVTIGDGAVIGAGAVVYRDVQAGETVYAQPAKSL